MTHPPTKATTLARTIHTFKKKRNNLTFIVFFPYCFNQQLIPISARTAWNQDLTVLVDLNNAAALKLCDQLLVLL